MLHMISIFINLLRFALWSSMWPILENFSWAHEKNVYSAALECNLIFFWWVGLCYLPVVSVQFTSVQWLSHVWLFATPWTAACHDSLFIQPPGVYSNSCPLSRWCHPTISSSVVFFSSCLQSFPASGSFQMSQFSHHVTKVLEFQLQHQSFQWIFVIDFL